jgi:hypothetical protein
MTELKKFNGSARFRNTVAEVQKTKVGHEEAQRVCVIIIVKGFSLIQRRKNTIYVSLRNSEEVMAES